MNEGKRFISRLLPPRSPFSLCFRLQMLESSVAVPGGQRGACALLSAPTFCRMGREWGEGCSNERAPEASWAIRHPISRQVWRKVWREESHPSYVSIQNFFLVGGGD